ncbi:MAG: DUF3857 domain-containing protein [Polaribacter sp.]
MKKIFTSIISIAFFFSLQGFSQKNNYSSLLIPAALTENANAVVREYSININIEDLDKMVVHKKEIVTVLNKLGNVTARIAEGYNKDTRITRLSAKIYDASGKELKKYSKGNFLDVNAVSGGTLYSDTRVKYVDYTPISYPYTVVFESEYKTATTGFIPSWFPVSGFYVSVEKSSFKIENPNRIPWRQKKMNFNGFPIKVNETETEILYSLENQPAYKYEKLTVNSREILPKAIVSLNKFYLKGVEGEYTNWKEFGIWMNNKLLKGRDQLSETTVTKIQNLVKGVKNPIEKAKLVYKYMQNKTRYISVQVGIGGWEPIAAKQVDKVGYGDCKGLVNYTKALLEAAGVTSYYTVVYADEKRNIDKDFSSIQGNHIILNIPTKKKDVWLECTSQEIPFGFLGDFTDDRNVLVITPNGGVIKHTITYKDEQNLQITTGEIQLKKDGGLTADLKIVTTGIQYNDRLHYDSFTKEKLIKNYKSNVWSYNNNLEIESAQLSDDKDNIVFTEDIKASIKNYAAINNTEYLFRVNVFNKDGHIPKRYRKRKLPLKISRGYKDQDTFTIKLPEGYVLEKLPSEKKITTKFGTYKVTLAKVDAHSFRYSKTIFIKEGTYPKEAYKAYRNFRRRIAKYENLRIAITLKK